MSRRSEFDSRRSHMTLISSQSLKGEKKEEPVAEKKLAQQDITGVDHAGRNVVVVAKGKPMPDDLAAEKRRFGIVEAHAQAAAERPRRGARKGK
jgi:hypothetical protein